MNKRYYQKVEWSIIIWLFLIPGFILIDISDLLDPDTSLGLLIASWINLVIMVGLFIYIIIVQIKLYKNKSYIEITNDYIIKKSLFGKVKKINHHHEIEYRYRKDKIIQIKVKDDNNQTLMKIGNIYDIQLDEIMKLIKKGELLNGRTKE